MKVTYKGLEVTPTATHCIKCNVLLDDEHRYFKIVKRNGKDTLTSSPLCKKHKLEDMREKKKASYKPKPRQPRKHKEPKPKYCQNKDCNILLTFENSYHTKYIRQDKSIRYTFFKLCKDCHNGKPKTERKRKVLTKKEKIIKVKKEKVVTLKKKLHKENIETIKTEEPIIITPSRRLTGREQAMRVFEEQKRRAERTQKEINEEKNKYIEWGMKRC